jgi:hypothetical protein
MCLVKPRESEKGRFVMDTAYMIYANKRYKTGELMDPETRICEKANDFQRYFTSENEQENSCLLG